MPATVDVRSLVLRDGDRVRGAGRLVRTPDGDWFEAPRPVRAVLHTAPTPIRGPSGQLAVRVVGADFEVLSHRHEHERSIEGYATIYGTWLGDRIAVDRQAPGVSTAEVFVIVAAGSHTKPGDLRVAMDQLAAKREYWGIYVWGPAADGRNPPGVHAALLRVTDELADWVASEPVGFISVQPALVPDRGGAADPG